MIRKPKNIYHMLAYAFRALNEDGYSRVAAEDFENVSDLFAAILSKGISNQIRRGLGREYEDRTDLLSSPTGKINVAISVKQQNMLRKQLACEFDEFTENSYMNRILKTTSLLLLRSIDTSPERKKALWKILLYFGNVDELDPRKIAWSSIKYHRNNSTYKMLINICNLVIEGMLLTEQRGSKKLAKYIDDQRMHRLFERFVFEYYRKHYPQHRVTASQIDWNVDDGIVDYLPLMKSDIAIKHDDKTLIIDTKYYTNVMQSNSLYNSRSLHSGNLYQIFTYVKNYDKTNAGDVSGVLLYAKTDEEITPDYDYRLSGNRIGVKTVDLNADFSDIRCRLNALVDNYVSIEASSLIN